jgi:hypothetical protein
MTALQFVTSTYRNCSDQRSQFCIVKYSKTQHWSTDRWCASVLHLWGCVCSKLWKVRAYFEQAWTLNAVTPWDAEELCKSRKRPLSLRGVWSSTRVVRFTPRATLVESVIWLQQVKSNDETVWAAIEMLIGVSLSHLEMLSCCKRGHFCTIKHWRGTAKPDIK